MHDKLDEYLDWIPEQMSDVRIKHVMMHCGGLTRDGVTDYWSEGEFPTQIDVENYVTERPPVKEPLQHWKYSNMGYGILGQLIEKVTGKTYAQVIKEEILDPLGMDDTLIDPESPDNYATGYGRYKPLEERKKMEWRQTNALTSATGIVSTVKDIARFAASTFTEEFVLNKIDLREMRKNHWDMKTGEKYGLGVKNIEVANRDVYGHAGSFPGHHSSVGICPDEEIAVVVMGNTIDLEIEKIMRTIMHTLLKAKDLYPEFEDEIDGREKLSGSYTNQWGETEIRKLNNGLVLYGASSKPLENYLKVVETEDGLELDEGTGYSTTGEEITLEENGQVMAMGASRSGRTEHHELGESALKNWRN